MTGARDFILLGIKYESARVAGVDDAALENIAEQLRSEAGEEWEADPMIVQGRNAVRREHGLERLGAPSRETGEKPPSRRRWWRFLGQRS